METTAPTTHLQGRVIVVTGASSGIGEASTRALVDAGATVIAVARRRDRLAVLAAHSPAIEIHVADVSDDEQVDRLADHVAQRHGRCDVLVNNAGVADGMATLRTRAHRRDVERVMDVNFGGAVRTMTAFFELLRSSAPSQVVNVASVAGKVGLGAPGYTASKFALVGLSEAVASDWDDHGITVTQLNPGYIATEGFPQSGLLRHPLTRRFVGTPEMVAEAVVDVIRHPTRERTVPRWYRPLIVTRHVAPFAFRLASRRLG